MGGAVKNYLAWLSRDWLQSPPHPKCSLPGNKYVSYQLPCKHLEVGGLAGALSVRPGPREKADCPADFNLGLKSGLFWCVCYQQTNTVEGGLGIGCTRLCVWVT